MSAASGSGPYVFAGGFPTAETVQRVYDELDLSRAVQCYRMFFPSVSGLAIFKGNRVLGLVDNEVFGTLQTEPRHVGLTLNSDTPYAPLLDLSAGPMVIELPPGRTPLDCHSALGSVIGPRRVHRRSVAVWLRNCFLRS